jgi:hypothetical protein
MKITKEELANIIKEEVEKTLEEKMSMEDYATWASKNDMELKTVLDKEDNMILVPASKPRLPKGWRDLSYSDPSRYWYRMWYKHGKKPAQGGASIDSDPGRRPGAAVGPRGISTVTQTRLPTEKDAMADLGYNPDGSPLKRKKRPGKKIPDLKVPKDRPKDGDFPFRDRSKPFKLKKEPRGPQKSSGVPPKPALKGRPILVNKAGKRTSLKTKDSQWKFRDGTLVPIYNYIRGRGRVEDEKGLKYYGLSLEEQVADFPSFADWWQGDNRKKYPTPSRAKRGYSIARSRAVSQTQKNLQKAADDLKDDQ